MPSTHPATPVPEEGGKSTPGLCRSQRPRKLRPDSRVRSSTGFLDKEREDLTVPGHCGRHLAFPGLSFPICNMRGFS